MVLSAVITLLNDFEEMCFFCEVQSAVWEEVAQSCQMSGKAPTPSPIILF